MFDAIKQLEPGYDNVYIYEVNAASQVNALPLCNHVSNANLATVTRSGLLTLSLTNKPLIVVTVPSGAAPYTFDSTNSVAVIIDFCTDSTVAYKGFKATYTTTTSTGLFVYTTWTIIIVGVATTNTETNEESGTITSLNYPNTYPNNYAHRWIIAPKSGKVS
jgi:hypothetical protein